MKTIAIWLHDVEAAAAWKAQSILGLIECFISVFASEFAKNIKDNFVCSCMLGRKRARLMKILILSYNNCANFGDRLGLDLLIRVLPPEAEIRISPLPPFWKQPEGSFDLVIVGMGHSVFHRTVDKQLIDFLGEQKFVVGIFGLQ